MKVISWIIAQIFGLYLKFKIINDSEIKQLIKEGDELSDKAKDAVTDLENRGLEVPKFMKKWKK